MSIESTPRGACSCLAGTTTLPSFKTPPLHTPPHAHNPATTNCYQVVTVHALPCILAKAEFCFHTCSHTDLVPRLFERCRYQQPRTLPHIWFVHNCPPIPSIPFQFLSLSLDQETIPRLLCQSSIRRTHPVNLIQSNTAPGSQTEGCEAWRRSPEKSACAGVSGRRQHLAAHKCASGYKSGRVQGTAILANGLRSTH